MSNFNEKLHKLIAYCNSKEFLRKRIEETYNELLNHKRRLNNLEWKDAKLNWKNRELERKNEELNRKNEELIAEKRREEQNIYNFKMTFEERKKNIEKINLEKSKEYITKLITNKFVKEFDNEEGKKNPFTISLIEHMKKFNEDYMEYCSKFIKSFKANSQKIVNEFNIKDNKIFIEHINFIVIGKAVLEKVHL